MRKIITTLCVILLGILPTSAQDAGWTAWLYNQPTGSMTQINQIGGVVDTFMLPLPAGADSYPLSVAVGHGGSPLAYVAYDSQTFQGILTISRRDQIVAQFALPLTYSDSFELIADESVFNEDNSQVALGYALDGGGWGLIVLDITTGQVTETIRHNDPLIAVLGLPDNFGVVPVVRRFNGNTVTFNLVQTGTEGAASYEGYDWNLDTGAVTSNPVYASLDSDIFPATGEVIMALSDERLENNETEFMFFQSNTIQVYDPLTGGRYPFYNAPDQSLYFPRFIQNGERILVDSVDSAQRYGWIVLERNGTLVGSVSTATSILDVHGVPEGFVYTSADFIPDVITLMFVDTRTTLGVGVPVWSSASGESPSLIWAGSDVVSAQTAYTPWAQLAAPVFASDQGGGIAPAPGQPMLVSPNDVSTPQAAPALGVLAAGGLATVNTTEGDQLNVRLGPGRDFDVVARLNDGERVTLIEGPRAGDGFVWWKIRTAVGIEGWVVESVADNGTRLQTLIPG